MLHFFRTYQKYFFILITIVIVISFSFFGTYSTLTDQEVADRVAFTAVDGSGVYASDVEEMTRFLASDSHDKLMYGGVWGPNFLNNGVIAKDFLQTGLAAGIAADYREAIHEDLKQRQQREKSYTPYTHPNAKFITVNNAWNYFAPEMTRHYRGLRRASDPTDSEAFAHRIGLYLGEKKFPAPAVRQVLRYQEKQYNWIAPDPDLDHRDLSLFGYHTLEDWFGPRFLRLVSEVIINGAKIAEQRGYRVSKEEALADLMRNAAISYQQNAKSPNLGVANSAQYFNEQLRRMHMDQTTAVHIWQQVLLFRRLFEDMGSAPLVAANTFNTVSNYANESVQGDIYQLPPALQLHSGRDLAKVETYINAVAKQKKGLDLPTDYKTADEVEKEYPELIQQRFLMQVSEINKKQLLPRVSIKHTVDWEVQEDNWKTLQQKFPELGIKEAATRAERFTALEDLDQNTRSAVDKYAREQIVDSHPEWIAEALEKAKPETIATGLTAIGGDFPFKGVTDRTALISLLEKAPAGPDTNAAAKEDQSQLNDYTGDGIHYYRIKVLERSPEREIQTFAEASDSGTIDDVLDRKLKEHYEEIRSQDPATYKNDDGSWKSFTDVSNSVTGSYVAGSLEDLGYDYVNAMTPKQVEKDLPIDRAATLRFFKHMREVQQQVQKNPETEEQWVTNYEESGMMPPADSETLPPRKPLSDQWKLIKKAFTISRSAQNSIVDKDTALNMQENSWSPVFTPADGNAYFFKVNKRGTDSEQEMTREQVEKAHDLLSDEAQQALMLSLLKIMGDKKAISLNYLNNGRSDDSE